MAKAKVTGKARVQLTVEIDVSGSWGEDCSIGQLNEQAVKSARDALRHGMVLDGLGINGASVRAQVIGTPKVLGILTSDA